MGIYLGKPSSLWDGISGKILVNVAYNYSPASFSTTSTGSWLTARNQNYTVQNDGATVVCHLYGSVYVNPASTPNWMVRLYDPSNVSWYSGQRWTAYSGGMVTGFHVTGYDVLNAGASAWRYQVYLFSAGTLYVADTTPDRAYTFVFLEYV